MTTYPPLNTLKPVATGLWIIDGPAVACRGLPISTRATVAQLANGMLWVHSPTELDAPLQAALDALGPVRHIVAPNWHHDVFLAKWKMAYPKAKVWGVPRDPGQGTGVDFDRPLGSRTPWQEEIDHLIIGGSRRYREAAFFHRASATLILADLIHNIETARMPVWARPLIWLAGSDDSDGKMPYLMRRTYRNSAELADAVEAMIAWRPGALILSHGRWFKRGATEELERAFEKPLRDRRWDKMMIKAKRHEQENS